MRVIVDGTRHEEAEPLSLNKGGVHIIVDGVEQGGGPEPPEPIIDTVVTTSEEEKNQLISDGYELVSEETKYYRKSGGQWEECTLATYNITASSRRKKETTYTLQKTIYPSS